MLATLRFLPLLGLPLTYAATIINASSLLFSPGWTQEFSQATQDSFMRTDTLGGSLAVTLPSAASSVSYIAFMRAEGSVYGYTLDCEDDCVLQTVNGTDPSVTDDASVLPSTIFSLDLDPSTQHTLRVYNIPSDQSDGSSQITFNSLSVDVVDNSGAVPNPGSLPGFSQLPDPSQTPTDSTGASSLPPTSNVSPSSLPGSTSLPVTPSSTPSSGSVGAGSSGAFSSGAFSSASGAIPSSILTTRRLSSDDTTTSSTRSSTSPTDDPSTPTNPVLQPSVPSSSSSSVASSSGATHGLSKSVTIGITVLIVALVAVILACLIVFLRQRRQRRGRDSFQSSSRPPLSPTGSIIPIMSPPQMRTASLNPFSDPYPQGPYPQGPMDSPTSSSIMQRRMESRSVSPSTAPPNIPLPDIPVDRRDRMEGRANSPASPFARNDLWITRSPARAQFSVV